MIFYSKYAFTEGFCMKEKEPEYPTFILTIGDEVTFDGGSVENFLASFMSQANGWINSGVMEGFRARQDIFDEAVQEAEIYDKLYHCTSIDALFSIVENKSFRLSNLERVNDCEEIKNINDPQLRDKVFIACFTYENDINEHHWEEYGTNMDGVLFSIKKEWFLKQVTPLWNNDITIHNTRSTAINQMHKDLIEGKDTAKPYYYIGNFDFLKVKYIDEKIRVRDDKDKISVTYLQYAGIVKDKEGLCSRTNKEPYMKNWEEEKEVRLRINLGVDGEYQVPFDRVEIVLSEDAFDEFEVRFAPRVDEARKVEVQTKLKELLPSSSITYLD